MARLKLTLAYLGTRYHGWQTQARHDPPLPTVQSLVEAEIRRIAGVPVHLHGSGRTDSGVHAEAQVAHVDLPEARMGIDWQLALNTSLPPDIRIVEATPVPDSFHAQFSAIRKIYEYRLWLTRRCTPPRLYPFVWACGPVDLTRMDAAARHIEGAHDFCSMRNRGAEPQSTVRTLFAVSRSPEGPLPSAPPDARGLALCGGPVELAWRFEANGFLKQMVRNLIGLLVATGQGKLHPDEVPDILTKRDRRHNGVTAPPQGLTLKAVIYDPADCPPALPCV